MKQFAAVLLGLICCATPVLARPGFPTGTEPGKRLIQMTVDGKAREFIVYQPPRIADVVSPVVFVFHGTSGSGEVAYSNYGWKQKADETGIVTVFPSSLRYHIFDDELVQNGEVLTNVSRFTTKWNFYGLPGLLDPKYDQVLYDDVKFVREIVAYVKQNYKVDTSRFYATGFSNGAQFTARLLAQMNDVFAAYAAVGAGGSLAPTVVETVHADPRFRARPFQLVLGERDPKMTHALGVTSFPMDASAVAPGTALHDKVVAQFLSLLYLTDQYQHQSLKRVSDFRYDQPMDGAATHGYGLAILKGAGHIYPNGENYPLKAADFFWTFFQKYRL